MADALFRSVTPPFSPLADPVGTTIAAAIVLVFMCAGLLVGRYLE